MWLLLLPWFQPSNLVCRGCVLNNPCIGVMLILKWPIRHSTFMWYFWHCGPTGGSCSPPLLVGSIYIVLFYSLWHCKYLKDRLPSCTSDIDLELPSLILIIYLDEQFQLTWCLCLVGEVSLRFPQKIKLFLATNMTPMLVLARWGLSTMTYNLETQECSLISIGSIEHLNNC